MPSMPVEDKNEGVGQPERGKELQTEDRCWGELCSYSSRRRVWALSGHSYPFIRRTPPPRIMTVFLIWKVFVLIKPNKLPLPFLTELLPCEFRSKGTDHLIFIVKFCEQTQSRRGSWPEFFLVFFFFFFFFSVIMAGNKSQEVMGQEQTAHFKSPFKAVAGWSLPSWFH